MLGYNWQDKYYHDNVGTGSGYQTLTPDVRPQTPEESINLLQSLLAEQIPGWTEPYRDDKSQANILDSLLYKATGGHPPYVRMFGEEEWSAKKKPTWWAASASTGKKTRHSDPSEVRPDTINVRNLAHVIAEIPHILQYRDPSWLKSKDDYTWSFTDKEWRKMYSTPGAFEYEAHSIIEPLIEKLLFNKFTTINRGDEDFEEMFQAITGEPSIKVINSDKRVEANALKYSELIFPENYRQNLMETHPLSNTYRINLDKLEDDPKVKSTSSVHDVGKLH